MKLVSLYSNKPKIFPPLRFREGFNVVFARVKAPSLVGHDSHNLGKTFLIEVIDFALLAKIKADHPFRQQPDLFDEFEFYIEIETNIKTYITIRRKVTGRQGIFINVSTQSTDSLLNLVDDSWTYQSLGVDKAQEVVNELLALDVLRPYTYRKGLGYFLRSQSDYSDEFELDRFHRGKDLDWKPFLALLLGFDHDLLKRKYDLDEQIKSLVEYQKHLESDADTKSEKYDELRGEIELREAESEKIRLELETFSFKNLEVQINDQVVWNIESAISRLNEELYTMNYELQEIDRSLKSGFEFDISEIQNIFKETQLYFPEDLARDYTELVDFNRKISSERNKRLSKLQQERSIQKESILQELEQLDKNRQSAMALLKEKATLIKYQGLQKRLLQYEEAVITLKQRLMYLDQAAGVKKEITEFQKELVDVESQLQVILRRGNHIYREIRKTFTEYVEAILNVQAILMVAINQNNNYEFMTKTIDREISGRETNESEGTSYKKLLCACFDLSILSVYSSRSFYRFVYHDGIFEGLDNRIKVRLLNLIRSISASKGIQYILTVIDTDLPRDDMDRKVLFTDEEIIRELSDEGEEGRLFRMRAF